MKIGLTKHQPDFFVTTLYDLLSLVRSVTLYEIAEFYLVVSGEFSNFAAMIAKRLIGIIVVGAVVLLTGCSGDKAKMLQQLEQLEQQNRSGEAMLNDSLAESLQRFTKYIAQRCKTSDG